MFAIAATTNSRHCISKMAKFDLDPRFERLRKEWYQTPNVLFNIIDRLKYREAVFLRKGTVHRCLKINKTDYFHSNAKRYHFYEEPMNLYGSLAHYPNMPMFSHNLKEKREEMDRFNEEYLDYMKGYDFLMDIDNVDIEHAYWTFKQVKKIFDEHKVIYWAQNSGKKGFHIRIDYEDFSPQLKSLSFTELAARFKKFAENFKMINGFDDIDTSIFDLRRIAKTPYSIVYPYYFVAMPLSDEQAENFKLVEYSLPYLISNTHKLFKRGVLKRTGTPQGFDKLLDEYDL